MTLWVHIATEDVPSEHVARKLVETANMQVARNFGLRGKTYLEKNFSKFVNLAMREPVLLIADFDRATSQIHCPSQLIEKWLDGRARPVGLLARVAVQEVESWLLADIEAFRSFFGVSINVPTSCDEINDPKSFLLNAAKKKRKFFREGFVRSDGGKISPGIAYNQMLSEWITQEWSPQRASERSPSLKRAMSRLSDLQELCGEKS